MNQSVFSESFRRHAVQKMFSRGQQPVEELARELGCSTPSLYKWAKSMKLSPVNKHVSKWTPLERCALIAEFSTVTDSDRGVWLRNKGLTAELIEAWTEAITASFAEKPTEVGLGRLRKEVRNLEHQLRRKETKLRQSAAVIDAQKKILELFEESQDESPASMTGKS
jgi:transposase-like protein